MPSIIRLKSNVSGAITHNTAPISKVENRQATATAAAAATAQASAKRDVSDLMEDAGFDKLEQGPAMNAVLRVLRKLTALLPGADPRVLLMTKIEATKRLTDLGFMGADRIVERAFKLARLNADPRSPFGGFAGLEDDDPWPDAVDGADLLDKISSVFKRYVALRSQRDADALALWVAHSYLLNSLTVTPMLAITSPEKRCGKTTVLAVVGALARLSLFTSNITAAALFRSIDRYAPTLVVDEADTLFESSPEIRGILNAGHTRTAAYVMRCAPDTHEPVRFSTWCPKVIAKIGTFPETIEDRSIPVRMRRKLSGDRVTRIRQERIHGEMADLRSQLRRWTLDVADELPDDPDVPDELHDRAQDNWRPLIAIADTAGEEWPARARAAARDLMAPTEDTSASDGVLLLGDLRDLFRESGHETVASDDLVARLVGMEERSWGDYQRGRAITAQKIAALLRPFRIQPVMMRCGDRTRRGYGRCACQDAFARYLPPDEDLAADNGGEERPMKPEGVTDVTGHASCQKPRPTIRVFRLGRKGAA